MLIGVIYNFPIGFCPCLFNIYGRLVRCNVSMEPLLCRHHTEFGEDEVKLSQVKSESIANVYKTKTDIDNNTMIITNTVINQ